MYLDRAGQGYGSSYYVGGYDEQHGYDEGMGQEGYGQELEEIYEEQQGSADAWHGDQWTLANGPGRGAGGYASGMAHTTEFLGRAVFHPATLVPQPKSTAARVIKPPGSSTNSAPSLSAPKQPAQLAPKAKIIKPPPPGMQPTSSSRAPPQAGTLIATRTASRPPPGSGPTLQVDTRQASNASKQPGLSAIGEQASTCKQPNQAASGQQASSALDQPLSSDQTAKEEQASNDAADQTKNCRAATELAGGTDTQRSAALDLGQGMEGSDGAASSADAQQHSSKESSSGAVATVEAQQQGSKSYNLAALEFKPSSSTAIRPTAREFRPTAPTSSTIRLAAPEFKPKGFGVAEVQGGQAVADGGWMECGYGEGEAEEEYYEGCAQEEAAEEDEYYGRCAWEEAELCGGVLGYEGEVDDWGCATASIAERQYGGVGWEESMGMAQGFDEGVGEEDWEQEGYEGEGVEGWREEEEGFDEQAYGFGEDQAYAEWEQGIDDSFYVPSDAADHWHAEGFASWGQHGYEDVLGQGSRHAAGTACSAAGVHAPHPATNAPSAPPFSAAEAAMQATGAWNTNGSKAGLQPTAKPFSVHQTQAGSTGLSRVAGYPTASSAPGSRARPIKDPTMMPKTGAREIRPPPGRAADLMPQGSSGAGKVSLPVRPSAPPPFPVHAPIGTLSYYLTAQEQEVFARLKGPRHQQPEPVLPKGVSEQMLDSALATIWCDHLPGAAVVKRVAVRMVLLAGAKNQLGGVNRDTLDCGLLAMLLKRKGKAKFLGVHQKYTRLGLDKSLPFVLRDDPAFDVEYEAETPIKLRLTPSFFSDVLARLARVVCSHLAPAHPRSVLRIAPPPPAAAAGSSHGPAPHVAPAPAPAPAAPSHAAPPLSPTSRVAHDSSAAPPPPPPSAASAPLSPTPRASSATGQSASAAASPSFANTLLTPASHELSSTAPKAATAHTQPGHVPTSRTAPGSATSVSSTSHDASLSPLFHVTPAAVTATGPLPVQHPGALPHGSTSRVAGSLATTSCPEPVPLTAAAAASPPPSPHSTLGAAAMSTHVLQPSRVHMPSSAVAPHMVPATWAQPSSAASQTPRTCSREPAPAPKQQALSGDPPLPSASQTQHPLTAGPLAPPIPHMPSSGLSPAPPPPTASQSSHSSSSDAPPAAAPVLPATATSGKATPPAVELPAKRAAGAEPPRHGSTATITTPASFSKADATVSKERGAKEAPTAGQPPSHTHTPPTAANPSLSPQPTTSAAATAAQPPSKPPSLSSPIQASDFSALHLLMTNRAVLALFRQQANFQLPQHYFADPESITPQSSPQAILLLNLDTQCLEGLWQAVELKSSKAVVCKQLCTCAPLPLALARRTLEQAGVTLTHGADGPGIVLLPPRAKVASTQQAQALIQEMLAPRVGMPLAMPCTEQPPQVASLIALHHVATAARNLDMQQDRHQPQQHGAAPLAPKAQASQAATQATGPLASSPSTTPNEEQAGAQRGTPAAAPANVISVATGAAAAAGAAGAAAPKASVISVATGAAAGAAPPQAALRVGAHPQRAPAQTPAQTARSSPTSAAAQGPASPSLQAAQAACPLKAPSWQPTALSAQAAALTAQPSIRLGVSEPVNLSTQAAPTFTLPSLQPRAPSLTAQPAQTPRAAHTKLSCTICGIGKAGWYSVDCRHMGPCLGCLPERLAREHSYAECRVCKQAVSKLLRVFS